jgi:hypothetical protein
MLQEFEPFKLFHTGQIDFDKKIPVNKIGLRLIAKKEI